MILLALDEEACLCVLEAWIAHVQEQARVSGICQRILRRMSNGLLARSMAAWGERAFELLESDIWPSSSSSSRHVCVCVYAKTRDLILLRSCYADAGETEFRSL